MIKNISPGQDGKFYWFRGVVENTSDDPLMCGRLRCRIIGKDTERLNQQPSIDLPLATGLRPLNGTHSSLDVKPGDWVFGFFEDGAACQKPSILAVYPGIKRAEYDTSKGFSPQLTPEQKKREPVAPEGVKVAGKDLNTVTGSPLLCRGDYVGTLIAQTNKEIIHVCDVVTQVKRNVAWERLKKSQLVSQAREAINAFIRSLSLSPDTISQRLIEMAKKLRRFLKKIQDLIDEFNDFLQVTIEVAKQLRAIIDWILSLPARLKAGLQNCLAAFLSGISSLVSDVLTLPGAAGNDVSAVITELKNTVQQAQNTTQSALNTLAIPAQIADAFLTPASTADIAKIQNSVSSYISQTTTTVNQTNQSAINSIRNPSEQIGFA